MKKIKIYNFSTMLSYYDFKLLIKMYFFKNVNVVLENRCLLLFFKIIAAYCIDHF